MCVEEKENLKSVYSEQIKEIEEISEKFKSIEKEYKNDIDQLEEMVTEERNQRNKIISEANALHCILNDKLDEMDKKLQLETEKVSALEQQLLLSSEKVNTLTVEKSEVVKELSLSKSRYLELESQILDERLKQEKELTDISTELSEEREKHNLLKQQYQDAQKNLIELDRVKGCIIDENSLLMDSLKKLEILNESHSEELKKIKDDYSLLMKEKEQLMVEKVEIEELLTNMRKIEKDYEIVTAERQMIKQELDHANENIAVLESSNKTNEEIIHECDKEKERLKQEIEGLNHNIEIFNDRISCANTLEEDLKKEILNLNEELQTERNQVYHLQSKLDIDTSELSTLLEKEKSALATKELEIKSLSDEILQSNKIINDLQDQLKANIEQISSLDNENGLLKQSISSGIEKMDHLKEQLKIESESKNELTKEIEDLKMEINSSTVSIEKMRNENVALEEKLDSLNQALTKVTEEKRNFSKKCLSLEKENETIKNKSDSEIKEMVAVLEKYKRECDEIVSQKEAKISSLLVDMDEIKKKKEHLEEEIMEKTLQVKMMDLELKLTAKDKEIAEKEVALLKNDSSQGDKIFSTPSRIKSPKVDGRKTPKMNKSPVQPKLYQSPGTPLRKESNTPGGMKKQVTFQEESSDTDASSVDAMILDNADLITRFEALERGVKVMTPIRVLPSPKNRKKRMEKHFKDEDKNSELMMKKARVNKQDYEETPRKNLAGILKPLRQFKDGSKNTGLDLDELFEMVED
ncbi:hypothetical protein J437_LFUL015878 [Ladona fulva]|uniref:Uncharacterized protein n=1 Tax=Ladona fulva TaxID=123851 RepID=A0A8K0NUS1_LADFU|nr:hypothetical protein J437_LFUL015878 [Ladona fulva]